MADDGLDQLDEKASRRVRSAGPSRRSRNKDAEAERQRREQEEREAARKRREEEAERTRVEEERRAAEEAEAKRRADAERQHEAEGTPSAQEAEVESAPPAPSSGGSEEGRRRPKSTPFYPDPDNEDFLWQIAEVAASRQVRIPSTAVLRLALRRLQDQMSPERIVQQLEAPVPTEGKRGRPRL